MLSIEIEAKLVLFPFDPATHPPHLQEKFSLKLQMSQTKRTDSRPIYATSVSARWRVPYAVEENFRGMTERKKE